MYLLRCVQAEYGNIKLYKFYEWSKNLSPDDLVKYKAYCCKKCYSEFTNIEKRNRALQRYTDALEQGKSTLVKWKAGCPSTNTLETKN